MTTPLPHPHFGVWSQDDPIASDKDRKEESITGCGFCVERFTFKLLEKPNMISCFPSPFVLLFRFITKKTRSFLECQFLFSILVLLKKEGKKKEKVKKQEKVSFE